MTCDQLRAFINRPADAPLETPSELAALIRHAQSCQRCKNEFIPMLKAMHEAATPEQRAEEREKTLESRRRLKAASLVDPEVGLVPEIESGVDMVTGEVK
jgi:hypothetical protein